eukprot:scaffold56752_cov24-Tisochrysis_lutea.AAC.1
MLSVKKFFLTQDSVPATFLLTAHRTPPLLISYFYFPSFLPPRSLPPFIPLSLSSVSGVRARCTTLGLLQNGGWSPGQAVWLALVLAIHWWGVGCAAVG